MSKDDHLMLKRKDHEYVSKALSVAVLEGFFDVFNIVLDCN